MGQKQLAAERAAEEQEAERMFAAEIESQEYERQEMLMIKASGIKMQTGKGQPASPPARWPRPSVIGHACSSASRVPATDVCVQCRDCCT